MKIVVTGALGHIGSKMIRELPSEFSGPEIVMVDNLLTQRYCSLFNLPTSGHYRFINADVQEADMASIIEGADAVLHLAAITDAASSFKNRDRVERNNYNATVKVAESCRNVGSPMIFISSTSVYGTQKDVVAEDCSDEELLPQSPYAETKLKEERFLQSLAASGDLRFAICRFGTICGTSAGMRFHTAINKFCWQAVMRQPLTVWRVAMHQKRPYLVLDDAVRAMVLMIRKGLFDGRVYNMLTENRTVESIVQSINRNVDRVDIEYVDTKIMNQLSYEVSNKRFREQGFEFTGSVDQAIKETIELLRSAGGSAA